MVGEIKTNPPAGEQLQVNKSAGHVCLDCGTPLTGAYCNACGQSAHVHRSLLHLIEELMHGLLHFDAKGWRTLPLLVAYPGILTRRYIEGQRTRYVSPLVLFLFMVFMMFFVASAVDTNYVGSTAADNRAAHEELAATVQQGKADIAKAEAELARARLTGGDVANAEAKLKRLRSDLEITELAQLGANAILSDEKPPGNGTNAASQFVPDFPVNTGIPFLDKAIRHAMQNPELTFYKLKNSAYKLSFMLIPISLPFLWLLFVGRRDVGMYDHAIFSLYSLSFMSLWFIAAMLIAYVGLGGVVAFLFLVPPVHMYLQLRDTYRLGRLSAAWRTVALMFVAGTVFLLFLALIFAVSMH